MIYQYISIFILSIIFDYIWLGVITKKYVSSLLGDLLIEKTRYDALFFIYIILSSAILFVVRHANSTKEALLYGAGLGFVIYSIYEFTNLAIIKNWPVKLVPIDIIWGTFMFGVISAIVFYISRS